MLHRRLCTPADLDGLVAHYAVPEVYRYLWDGSPAPREVVAELVAGNEASFAAHGYGLWVLEDPDAPDAGVIGSIGLRVVDERPACAEIVYSLDPRYWGRGLITAEAHAVLRHGFEHCGLAEIIGGTDEPNVASQRVLERLGMRPIGTRAFHGNPPGPYWSLTRPDRDGDRSPRPGTSHR